MASLSSLPNEIIFHIFEDIADSPDSLNTLANFACISRKFYEVYKARAYDLTLRSANSYVGPFFECACLLAHIKDVWNIFRAWDNMEGGEVVARPEPGYQHDDYTDMAYFEDVLARPITVALLRKAYRAHFQLTFVVYAIVSRTPWLSASASDPKKLIHFICVAYETFIIEMGKDLDFRFNDQYGYDYKIAEYAKEWVIDTCAVICATRGLGDRVCITEDANGMPDRWIQFSTNPIARLWPPAIIAVTGEKGMLPHAYFVEAMKVILAEIGDKRPEALHLLVRKLRLWDWYRYLSSRDDPARLEIVVDELFRRFSTVEFPDFTSKIY